MRNNETGEFELVVGNKQLLSAFFIVVLLFAVAFAMGYIFGQNSPRSARLQTDAAQAPAAAPADQRPLPGTASPAADAPAPAPDTATPAPADSGTDAAGEPAAPPPPQPTTQPARESPAATTPAAAPPQPAPAPAKAATRPVSAQTTPAPAPAATQAAPGTYWQVMAVNSTEAEVVAKALKDKGFPASTAPGPNNLMRVLVGPYSDTQAMGRAKTQLESAGFHPIRK